MVTRKYKKIQACCLRVARMVSPTRGRLSWAERFWSSSKDLVNFSAVPHTWLVLTEHLNEYMNFATGDCNVSAFWVWQSSHIELGFYSGGGSYTEVGYYLGNEIIQRSWVSVEWKHRADGIFMYTAWCQVKSWAESASWKPRLVW